VRDTRIGSRFLQPGIGYGGSCFPNDLKAFRTVAKEFGFELGLLDEIIRINEEQIERFARKVRNALWNLKGKRIAALGLAFKTGTDDIRESPAIALIQRLLKEGSDIRAYDPAAREGAAKVLPTVRFFGDAYAVARGADASSYSPTGQNWPTWIQSGCAASHGRGWFLLPQHRQGIRRSAGRCPAH